MPRVLFFARLTWWNAVAKKLVHTMVGTVIVDMGVDARERIIVRQVDQAPTQGETPGVSKLGSSHIYEILRSKILDHEIAPATKINVHGVARELGVSPTPVREALRLLQGDRLVVSTSNKGYQTTPVISADEVSDLFEFRLIVEPWAASVVSSNRLRNPGKAMLEDIESLRPMTDLPEFRHLLVSHDTRFHNMLLSATGNSAAVIAFEQLHFHLHLFRIDHFLMEPVDTLAEHEEIAQAIVAKDPVAAEKAMREHLTNGYRRFSVRVAQARQLSTEIPDSPHFG